MSNARRFAWAPRLVLGLALGAGLVGEDSWGQTLPAIEASPVEPGKALAEGIRLYRRGEFEIAARAFQTADQGSAQLSEQDQSVLAEYRTRASRAMVERNRAAMDLSQAEAALQTGRHEEGRMLLKRVSANIFASPEVHARAESLERPAVATSPVQDSVQKDGPFSRFRVFNRSKQPRPVTENPPMPSAPRPAPVGQFAGSTPAPATDSLPPQEVSNAVQGDAGKLLVEGRNYFRKGFLNQAERWAHEAAKANVTWDPVGDSPQRLLADIQAQRAKAGIVQSTSNKVVPTSGDPRSEAQALLTAGRRHLEAGEFAEAEEVAFKVFMMDLGLKPEEGDTPEQLWADIKRRKSGEQSVKPTAASPTRSPQPTLPTSGPPAPRSDGSSAKYKQEISQKSAAMGMVKQARKAFQTGDYQTAIRLAHEAEATGVTFAPHEDSPEKIYQAHEAVRARMEQRRKASETVEKTNKARSLVVQASKLMEQGKFQEAVQVAEQALALNGVFQADELTPSQLLLEIGKAAARNEFAKREELNERAAQLDENVRPVAFEAPQDEFESAPETETVVQTANRNDAAALIDAGINAMGRNDYEGALSYLQDASNSNRLTEDDRQRIQELTNECTAKLAKGASSKPGKRTISDERIPRTTRSVDEIMNFAGAQEPEASADGRQPEEPRKDVNTDEIEQAKQRQAIVLQKLRQDVIIAIEQASLQLRGNPDRAIETLRSAVDTVKNSGLDPDLTANLVTRLEAQIRQYQRTRQEILVQNLERDQQEAARDAHARTQEAEITKQKTIKQLSNRFNALMDEGNYAEAKAVALQIIELDPNEPFGVAAIHKATWSDRWARIEAIENAKSEGWYESLQSAELSAIPIPDNTPITFPDAATWEALSSRREKYKSVTLEKKSEATVSIEKALDRPVSFDFKETQLRDVIDFIKDYTNVNVVLDANGLDIAGVQDDEPITLQLDQVPLRSALKLLLDPLELTYLIRDDVLLITDREETGAQLVTKVYPVADLVIPIANFQTGGFGVSGGGGGLGGGGFGGGGGGGFGGGGGGFGGGGGGLGGGGLGGGGGGFGGGGGGIGGGGQIGEDINEDVIELIQNTVFPDEWEENGGVSTIEYFQPNRSFVVTAPQKVHEGLADLFDQLRRLQDLQVSVEVRFITVSESFFERIGVDFDVSFDNNNDNYIIQEQNRQTNPPGVTTPLTDSNGLGVFDGNHVRGVTVGRDPAGIRTSNYNIPLSQSSFAAATVPALAGLGATNLGGTNFGIAFLNDIDVFLLLEAVQGDRRANTLQAPKVTLFNGQTANVRVTDQVPFVTDATPVISAGAVTFDPTIETIQDGTTVQVQAVISADRRFVRLTVVPLLQTIEPLANVRTVNVGGTAGAGGFGGLAGAAQVTVQLPIVSQVSVLTTVSVPDGGTVLLGGLKTHREARNEFGTPVLSKLPYINRLFKNAATARVTDSLMLLVSPRIIILEEEEEDLGKTSSTVGVR